eukprot:XP_011662873.1 PREDICTED: uncharacterized protein LOC105437686 [Strongylocentrotus purpuratus]
MPVSLGEWRVRIGTFMRRRRKEYDYHYFWRKLHNLIKRNKNAEQPREDNNPECNISSRTGSSSDAKRSPSNTARQSASSCNANLNINQTGPSCDVNNDRGNANSPTLSQFDVPECNTKCGSPCDSNNPGHNDVSHSEYPSAENSGSSIEKKTNPVLDTTEVKIPVLQPCVEDELDNRNISISLMSYEYTPKSDQISKKDKPKVGTSESYSDVPGEIGRIKLDEEETSDSRPSGKEDQTTDLSPKPRIHTTRNTDQRTSSIREVTENHGSPTYPIPLSGTSIGEADAIKGNDCPDMATILLLRSGDVERNPGPNNNPGSLGELELYLLADGIDPSDFRKVGLALGFPEAKLSQFEKDKLGNSMQATYQMLYEWRKTVPESEAREILVNKLESIKLVQLADSVRKGQVGDHIPSMTEEEIQRVAEEVKHYLAIHICQIQVDPLNNEVVLEFKRIFTNLTLMKEDKGSKLNTPLLYDDLLRTKVNGIYPKRLLVEGEGGVGKTTFCAKIAWDWIHGIGYQDFKLVLVILLREAGAKTVGEIVKSYLSDNNPVTAKQLDKHILSNSDDVFLVLDGLDEFAVDLDSNQQIALITLYLSGHIFIMNQREVDHLSIEKPCGRTASEDQAEFICSSRSPKSVTIASTMHDIFYSVLANKAGDSKIETLNIYSLDLSKRPSASRDLAQFICKMPHLERLSHGKQGCSEYRLNVLLHDDFYSTSSSIASSTKIETLDIKSLDLSEHNPDCGPKVCLHDDFYSTSSSIASSAKVSI